MENRRWQNHQQQQSPSVSTPPLKTQRLQEEEEDQWWKSDEEEEEGSMAAKAIRASSGSRRDSSLSSAYATPHPLHPKPQPPATRFQSQSQNRTPTSSSSRGNWIQDSLPNSTPDKRNSADSSSKPSFWSTIARKAKSIIDDEGDDVSSRSQSLNPPFSAVPSQSQKPKSASGSQFSAKPFGSHESTGQHPQRSSDGPRLHKGFGAIASSLTYIGGTIGNALEEGLTIVENRTADIIQETRKLNVRKKFGTPDVNEQDEKDRNANIRSQMQTSVQPQMQSDLEIQLKASRDVSMAMAAKTKVLLRELKTVKADLAFAKERCAQLEEENKLVRESLHKGDNLEDDDLIRLQLESLLAEKARLAHENSVFARENRFLREIVEYHQLTMQDVVYLDENSEEVTEVYPAKVPSLANLHAVDNVQQPPLTSPMSLRQD